MKNKRNKKGYTSNILLCIVFNMICGFIVGLVIFGFKYLAKQIEHSSMWIYEYSKETVVFIPVVFISLILLAALMYILHVKVPDVKGGGIPRSEGVLRGILPIKPVRTFFGTIVGSFISYFAGLPLGTEGPSVIIGTCIGDMCSKTSKKTYSVDRYIKTGGAAAGFAVATGAPFSGVLFALEEIHKRFTPMLVISVSVSCLSAMLINLHLCELCNIDPRLFEFGVFEGLSLKHVLYLAILAILISLIVLVFDKTIKFVNNFTSKHTKVFHPLVKLIFVFIVTGILGYVYIDCIYSGHDVVHHVAVNNISIVVLFALLIVRLLMMFILVDSNATGGIFIPVLAIGAILGAILAKLLVLIGLGEEYYSLIVVMTMCAFIGGTLRAPFTACVLFLELTLSVDNLFYVLVVVFIVNVITEVFNEPSFYDRALGKMEHEFYSGKTMEIGHFEVRISENAFVVGKAVRDILWPFSTVVLSVRRHKETELDMDNDGEKKLYAKDVIVLRSKYYDEDEVKSKIYKLVGSNYEIKKIEK